jgi:hypothetical protein
MHDRRQYALIFAKMAEWHDMTLIHNGIAALPYHHYIGLRGFPMNGSELSERVAKAVVDIQDAANLILLDLLAEGEPGDAAKRFAAIQQYATRALDELSTLPGVSALQPSAGTAESLRQRARAYEAGSETRRAIVDPRSRPANLCV